MPSGPPSGKGRRPDDGGSLGESLSMKGKKRKQGGAVPRAVQCMDHAKSTHLSCQILLKYSSPFNYIMLFCIICSFRKFYPVEKTNPEQQSSFSAHRELNDLHRFSFNSLMALLAVLTIKGSKTLLPVVLALLIYTISLRLTVSTCFIENYPILARSLHVIPLIGTFCMAGIELVLDMRSPALAVVILLISTLPLVTIVLHHGRHCKGYEEAPLPVRMPNPAPSTVGRNPDATAMVSS